MAVTSVDIQQLEKFADRIFADVGIDVEFTKHFLDRVNDERNDKPIVPAELTRLFKQERKRYGKPIAQLLIEYLQLKIRLLELAHVMRCHVRALDHYRSLKKQLFLTIYLKA